MGEERKFFCDFIHTFLELHMEPSNNEDPICLKWTQKTFKKWEVFFFQSRGASVLFKKYLSICISRLLQCRKSIFLKKIRIRSKKVFFLNITLLIELCREFRSCNILIQIFPQPESFNSGYRRIGKFYGKKNWMLDELFSFQIWNTGGE